jgi:phosphohistidine phosphatase SixA
MNLYLMRHGMAVEPGVGGVRGDAERPLSKDGIRKTAQIAEGLRAIGIAP